MSKIQYQQKSATNQSTELPSQQNQERRQRNERPYNNNNRSYNANNSNGNYNNNRKPRYQDKERAFRSKFGFEYDESKIGYNTEIPEMPEKPKHKPDQAKYNKKVEELKQKETQLKRLRKEKKDTYKNGSKSFRDQIQEQKRNIELAKACLVILNLDKVKDEDNLEDVQFKVTQHKRKIDLLNKPVLRTGKNVKFEEMTYGDLVREEERISQEMSLKSLTKAEQVQYSNRLNKIKKRKVEVPKESAQSTQTDDRTSQINHHRNALEKLRHVRETLTDRITDFSNKIESIEDDIQQFQETIEQIHNKLRYTDNSKLLQQAAKLKEQIYAVWDELKQLEEQQNAKIHQFEYEQEKIKYIQWAKEIKTKKAQDWQLEKQQRKRLRLKEKEISKKKPDQKDQKQTKQGDKKEGQITTQQKPQFERKKINRNQKEIDICSFLIQYCRDLSQGEKTEEKQSQQQVKLEDALKKGEWAKMKNVEVIKSKKSKAEEQAQQKTYKKRENKNTVTETNDRFSHTYFVAQIFDSVKVLPPTKPQELENVINQLEDKMEYYIAHPDEGVERSLLPVKEGERETKTRAPRKIINTEEFPSLR